MKKTTFITTVNHNIGDDYVREGLKFLLNKYFKNEKLEFVNIHKHSPITSRYGFEWFRYYRLSKFIDEILPLSFTKDKILESDLIVQSGAPVYWCHDSISAHCSENEWYGPLIRRRFTKNTMAKLLNLAAGTCQEYYSDGLEFLNCAKDLNYIKEFHNLAVVNTVRDALSKKVLNSIGLDAKVIPCSSIFAIDEYNLKPERGDFVAFNYMSGGGHYTFGQKIDFTKWEKELARFYREIAKYEKVIFVCHDEKEAKTVKKIDSEINIFISKNYMDYLKFYSKAKIGIFNRVHGAFLLASFGRPSVVIGSDSRARMVEEIGLKSVFVNEANKEYLMKSYEYLIKTKNAYKEKIESIKIKAYRDYMKALSVL